MKPNENRAETGPVPERAGRDQRYSARRNRTVAVDQWTSTFTRASVVSIVGESGRGTKPRFPNALGC